MKRSDETKRLKPWLGLDKEFRAVYSMTAFLILTFICPISNAGILDADFIKRHRLPLAQLLALNPEVSMTNLLHGSVDLADANGVKFYLLSYESAKGPVYFYLIDEHLVEDHQFSHLFFYNGEGIFPSHYLPDYFTENETADRNLYAGGIDPKELDLETIVLENGTELQLQPNIRAQKGIEHFTGVLLDRRPKDVRELYLSLNQQQLHALASDPAYVSAVASLTKKLSGYRQQHKGTPLSETCSTWLNSILANIKPTSEDPEP